MSSQTMPTIPWTIFFILEPISLLTGFLAAHLDALPFAASQIPPSSPLHIPYLSPTSHSEVLVLQLGNLYLLMALLGVSVIMHIKEPWLLRNYLIVLAIGDLGHLYASVYGLGGSGVAGLERAFRGMGGWDGMAWGNVGATVGLFVMRVLTVMGGFGGMGRGAGRVKGE